MCPKCGSYVSDCRGFVISGSRESRFSVSNTRRLTCGYAGIMRILCISRFPHFPRVNRIRAAFATRRPGVRIPLSPPTFAQVRPVLGTGLLACLGARCGKSVEVCTRFASGFSALRFRGHKKRPPSLSPGDCVAQRGKRPRARVYSLSFAMIASQVSWSLSTLAASHVMRSMGVQPSMPRPL